MLFLLLTAAVVAGWTSGVDLLLTRDVQSMPWGPLQPALALADQWDGVRQMILAATVLLIVFAFDRRLGVQAVLCCGSGWAWYVLELWIGRPRPDSHLVHVVRHAGGSGYPSGHVIFYCWALAILALAISARLPRRIRFLPWVVAALALGVVSVGRIVYGEHWPSDVLGGLLLGSAWVLAVMYFGERWRQRQESRVVAVEEAELRKVRG
jgi:membrane-associated phospholipid phosphatase